MIWLGDESLIRTPGAAEVCTFFKIVCVYVSCRQTDLFSPPETRYAPFPLKNLNEYVNFWRPYIIHEPINIPTNKAEAAGYPRQSQSFLDIDA